MQGIVRIRQTERFLSCKHSLLWYVFSLSKDNYFQDQSLIYIKICFSMYVVPRLNLVKMQNSLKINPCFLKQDGKETQQ